MVSIVGRLASRAATLAFVGLALVLALQPPGSSEITAAAPPYDPVEKSIAELQAAMASGRVTSEELVAVYLDRIHAYDQQGPAINAMVYLNPNAQRDARALDEERARSGPRGPLHGIPAIIKDNFDTKDMPTTGGLAALAGSVPNDDAFMVRKLREAGVVFLGKANMPDTAFTFYNLSSITGQSLSPYAPQRAASGGSSSAAAATVTSNFAAFTLGSDTCGSIRGPANYNNIFGLRPTFGLSSRDGVMPISHSSDATGPLARSMRDLALLLDVTLGYDPNDGSTAASVDKVPATYTAFLNQAALRGARIGVLETYFETPPLEDDYIAVARAAIKDMERQGATVVSVSIPGFTDLVANANIPFASEFREDFNAYLAQRNAPIKSLEELLASGLYHANVNNAIQTTLEGAQANTDLNTPLYMSRVAGRQVLQDTLVKLMDDNKLDAIAYPYAKVRPPLVGTPQAGINCSLSPYSALPAMNLPAGFTADGIPVGLELLGRPWDDGHLLGLAYAFEQNTRHRRLPPATPRLGATPPASTGTSAVPAVIGVRFDVEATGAQASPSWQGPFSARGRFTFNEATRQLGYAVAVSGISPDQVTGIYLHRRSTRPNGPVIHVLATQGSSHAEGVVTLTESQLADLHAGNVYFTAVATGRPLVQVRGNLVLPPSP